MAVHARLKNEFMEDEKYHNLMTWLKLKFTLDDDPKYLDRQVLAKSVVLKEQSDQGLHCLSFCLHHFNVLLNGRTTLFQFLGNYSNFWGFPNFCVFTVPDFSAGPEFVHKSICFFFFPESSWIMWTYEDKKYHHKIFQNINWLILHKILKSTINTISRVQWKLLFQTVLKCYGK